MRKLTVFLLPFFLSLPLAVLAFDPPSEDVRREAIGDLRQLPLRFQRAFAIDAPGFYPIAAPGPEDWLAHQHEDGQTFSAFRASQPNRPTARQRTIYLQPMGDFPADQSPSIEKLRTYAEAFFFLDVKILPPLAIEAGKFSPRKNPITGNPQILSGDVLTYLKGRVPADAYCVLGVTMQDLYPQKTWNFVFGQASLRDRVGIYSFARYSTAFLGIAPHPEEAGIIFQRSCKVLTHETGHMFGLAHCIYYECVMNGTNHLGETDSRPMHLCPVCLRKLQWSIGFDVAARYEALQKAERETGLADEAEWTTRQLQFLNEK